MPLCLLPAKGDPAELLQEVMETKTVGSRWVRLIAFIPDSSSHQLQCE